MDKKQSTIQFLLLYIFRHKVNLACKPRDPLKNAERSQGANLYWYVANTAVNRVDPSGLQSLFRMCCGALDAQCITSVNAAINLASGIGSDLDNLNQIKASLANLGYSTLEDSITGQVTDAGMHALSEVSEVLGPYGKAAALIMEIVDLGFDALDYQEYQNLVAEQTRAIQDIESKLGAAPVFIQAAQNAITALTACVANSGGDFGSTGCGALYSDFQDSEQILRQLPNVLHF